MAHQGNEADAAPGEAEQPAPAARPVPAPRPRRTIVDIQQFSGKETEDITEWLLKWDIAAAANNWSDEQQLQMIPAYLSGRAARHFWRMPQEARRDLEQLKDLLEDTFNTEEKKFLARQKLQEITQGSRESVMEFSERVDRLVIKGHDGLDSTERKDRIACESFVKGLRPEIKETVWEKSPHTFQEAVTAAERREVYLNSVGRRGKVNEISDDVMAAIQKFNEDRTRSNEEIWQAIKNLTVAVQDLAVKTAESSQQQIFRQQNFRGNRPNTRSLVCYECNQPGHIKRNCPQKQRGQPIQENAASMQPATTSPQQP